MYPNDKESTFAFEEAVLKYLLNFYWSHFKYLMHYKLQTLRILFLGRL